jgi:hypothetical protein
MHQKRQAASTATKKVSCVNAMQQKAMHYTQTNGEKGYKN